MSGCAVGVGAGAATGAAIAYDRRTTGTMVDTTIWYFLNMEDACKSQLLAEAVGKPIVIPHDTACATRDYVANDLSAYVSFQPTIDVLWEEEPDLLD